MVDKMVLREIPRKRKTEDSRVFTGDLMVGLGGLEPPTSPLSGARSSHLSYRPVNRVANDSPTLSYIAMRGNSSVQMYVGAQRVSNGIPYLSPMGRSLIPASRRA